MLKLELKLKTKLLFDLLFDTHIRGLLFKFLDFFIAHQKSLIRVMNVISSEIYSLPYMLM